MEPIRSDRSRSPSRRSSRGGGARSGGAEGAFSRQLSETGAAQPAEESAAVEAALESVSLPAGVDAPTERLFDAVHQAGQRLLDEQTYSAAQAYREAVQRFMQKVMPEANAVQVHESGYGILSRKRYFRLTEINRSVDRLVRGLMHSQERQLDMLRRLEEIQGMLIDLLH